MEFSELIANFETIVNDGIEYRCKCPACGGDALEVKRGNVGALFFCPTCDIEKIFNAVGLPAYERFYDGIESPENAGEYLKEFDSWGDQASEPEWEPPESLEYFHQREIKGNNYGQIKAVYHNRIFEHLKECGDVFIYKGRPYIYKNGFWKLDENGTQIKSRIKRMIISEGNLIKANTINEIYKLFFMDSDITAEEINLQPKEWIPFENGFYNPIDRVLIPYSERTKKYKCTLRSPHKFRKIDKKTSKHIKPFLEEILPEADAREMFLEFAGYCLTYDFDFHKALFLIGPAGRGKSKLVELIMHSVGLEDSQNTPFGELETRFGLAGLLNKRVNYGGDVEGAYNMVNSRSFKAIVGEEYLSYQPKGVDSFKARNGVKLITCFNDRPKIIGENSMAVYRRMLVIPITYTPKRYDSKLSDKLKSEIDYFIQEIVAALERAYERGHLLESGSSKEYVNETRRKNDTTEAFLQDMTEKAWGSRVDRLKLYAAYEDFCANEEQEPLSRNAFYSALDTKGYKRLKSGNNYFILGLKMKEPDFVQVTQEKIPFN